MDKRVITIDGLNGTGKSTLAKGLAKAFNFSYLSAGTIFRSLAYFSTQHGIEPHQTELIVYALQNMNFQVQTIEGETRAFIGGEDVTDKIKSDEYAVFASKFSNNQFIQDSIRSVIRETAKTTDLVVDGRDMGTVVFPNADAKIVLEASLMARAERRSLEQNIPVEEVARKFSEIDERAKQGFYSPPADAKVIDTTEMSRSEVLSVATSFVSDKLNVPPIATEDLSE